MQAGLPGQDIELDERARRGRAAHEPSRARPHGRGGHQRLLRGSKCDSAASCSNNSRSLSVSFAGTTDLDHGVEVALAALRVREALAAQTQAPIARRARGHPHPGAAREGRRRRRWRRAPPPRASRAGRRVEVAPVDAEVRVGSDAHAQEEVARWAGADALPALPGQADSLAVAHAGGMLTSKSRAVSQGRCAACRRPRPPRARAPVRPLGRCRAARSRRPAVAAPPATATAEHAGEELAERRRRRSRSARLRSRRRRRTRSNPPRGRSRARRRRPARPASWRRDGRSARASPGRAGPRRPRRSP